MTATQVTEAQAPVEQEVRRWTRERIIDVLTDTNDVDRIETTAFVHSFLDHIVPMIDAEHRYWRPSTEWLTDHHRAFLAAIPDNTTSTIDSGHRGIEEVAAAEAGISGVVQVTHDMQIENGLRYCGVAVDVHAVRVN